MRGGENFVLKKRKERSRSPLPIDGPLKKQRGKISEIFVRFSKYTHNQAGKKVIPFQNSVELKLVVVGARTLAEGIYRSLLAGSGNFWPATGPQRGTDRRTERIQLVAIVAS